MAKIHRNAVHVRRVYEPPDMKDGTRILVDRLWPRGLGKADAAIDLWLRDVAPSAALRRWFGHDPRHFAEFRLRYLAELEGHPEALAQLQNLHAAGDITLLFAARDAVHNNAVVLSELLLRE